MDAMENPLFQGDLSDAASSHSSSASSDDALSLTDSFVQPPSATVLQTVNIKNHIPVELDLTDSNYTEWRSFFDTVVGKFGLRSHLTVAPTSANRHDADWVMVDQCILSWLYNTISKDVRAIVRVPKATAYKVWRAIQAQFRDHELHRAVYLEAELRSLVQGDMDITTYTGRLKRLADGLRDLGQPVRETSQVINMLRGLSPSFVVRCR
jgi:hypothetical protein